MPPLSCLANSPYTMALNSTLMWLTRSDSCHFLMLQRYLLRSYLFGEGNKRLVEFFLLALHGTESPWVALAVNLLPVSLMTLAKYFNAVMSNHYFVLTIKPLQLPWGTITAWWTILWVKLPPLNEENLSLKKKSASHKTLQGFCLLMLLCSA